ncbi:armadillo-type protein [Spinellus fusiger]|nr:armadillo-type protein [Spinellus fusiger]
MFPHNTMTDDNKLSHVLTLQISEVHTHTTALVEAIRYLHKTLLHTPSDTGAWENATHILQVMADTVRQESARTPLGEAGLVEETATLLRLTHKEHIEFKLQVLRFYGNMCFDHDENRKRVQEAQIMPFVLPLLDYNVYPQVVYICSAFCFNVSVNYKPVQVDIANHGGAALLGQLLDPRLMQEGEDSIITMASKVVDTLLDEESFRDAFSTEASVVRLLKMIHYGWKEDELSHLDIMEHLTDALLQIVLDNDAMQNTVATSGFFPLLLDFLEYADLPVEDPQETQKEAEEEKEEKRLADMKETISKIAVYATSTDEMMESIYKEDATLKRLVEMIHSPSIIASQTATYILGNLARTDEHCVELVANYGLEKELLKLFQSTESGIFQYAILGCLKHLCLPKENKTVIGDEGTIEIIASMLDTSKDLVKRNQFFAIGILKLLCTGHYENSRRIIQETAMTEEKQTPIELILAFIQRVDDVAAKSEATRILTHLVRSIGSQQESLALRTTLLQHPIIEPIIEMVRSSKFMVLKNDGIVALTLLFADTDVPSKNSLAEALPFLVAVHSLVSVENTEADQEEEEEKEEKETRTFLQVIVDSICSESEQVPDEIRCNACTLLEMIAGIARLVENKHISDIFSTEVYPQLRAIENASPIVVTRANKAADSILMGIKA